MTYLFLIGPLRGTASGFHCPDESNDPDKPHVSAKSFYLVRLLVIVLSEERRQVDCRVADVVTATELRLYRTTVDKSGSNSVTIYGAFLESC